MLIEFLRSACDKETEGRCGGSDTLSWDGPSLSYPAAFLDLHVASTSSPASVTPLSSLLHLGGRDPAPNTLNVCHSVWNQEEKT